MKKISAEIENEIVFLTEKGQSAREVAKKVGVCHQTVLQVRKKRNCHPPVVKKGRKGLLTNRDARAMEHLMSRQLVKTPKIAAAAINKPVSEWTARRALRKIGLVSAVKQKKTRAIP